MSFYNDIRYADSDSSIPLRVERIFVIYLN